MSVALAAAGAIALTWAGYPLAVALLARFRPLRRQHQTAATLPSVTVVIATRDDPAVARRRVDDVLAGDYPLELLTIVVGLDGAGDLAAAHQIDWAGGRIIAVGGDGPGGKAATLNAAVRAATGELLVFTDVGQRFERTCIRRLAESLALPGVGAASGRLEIEAGRDGPSLSERYWRYERWLRRAEARLHSTVGVTGAVYAMPRRLWAPLPAGLILDDLYVPMRLVLAGHRIAFVDDARATDARRFDASQEFRRKARTLTGVIQLCAWLPAVLVPWHNPIWLQFVMHKLLRLLTPYLLLAAAGGLAWELVDALRSRPRIAASALAAALALVCGALLHSGLRSRVRRIGGQAVGLQLAVVVATVNGMRGRWDVWQR